MVAHLQCEDSGFILNAIRDVLPNDWRTLERRYARSQDSEGGADHAVWIGRCVRWSEFREGDRVLRRLPRRRPSVQCKSGPFSGPSPSVVIERRHLALHAAVDIALRATERAVRRSIDRTAHEAAFTAGSACIDTAAEAGESACRCTKRRHIGLDEAAQSQAALSARPSVEDSRRHLLRMMPATISTVSEDSSDRRSPRTSMTRWMPCALRRGMKSSITRVE